MQTTGRIDLKRYARLFAGLLLLALGAGLVFNAEGVIRATNSLTGPNPQCSWPTAQGSIAGSEMENHVHANGEDDWGFAVRFTYDIGGLQHAGSQWLRAPDAPHTMDLSYLFKACADSRDMTETAALFQAAHDQSEFVRDRPVVVYFNPAHNDEAVLAPGLIAGTPLSYGEAIAGFVSVFLCLGGLLMLFAGIRVLRRPSPAMSIPQSATDSIRMQTPALQLQIAPLPEARRRELADFSCAVCVALGSLMALLFCGYLVNSRAINATMVAGILLSLGVMAAGLRLRRRS